MKDEEVWIYSHAESHHLEAENETGRLSNHQALAALAAYNIFKITGDDRARRIAEDRVELTLSWQNQDEGWFQEYEGADLGITPAPSTFLAKLRQKMGTQKPDDSLLKPLIKAAEFSWHFMHPDGSYGGEYGSRNTYHFYPHGFELLAPHCEKASSDCRAFSRPLPHDKRYHNDDDRMTAHYVYDFLEAWADYHPERPRSILKNRSEPTTVWMEGAKWSSHGTAWKTSHGEAATSSPTSKGGNLKIFDADGPIASDTGLIGELEDGTVAVAHLIQHDNIITPHLISAPMRRPSTLKATSAAASPT